MKAMNQKELKLIAQELRVWIIEMLEKAGSGHPGGSLSAIDLMSVLFFHEMKGVEFSSLNENRDRFILSKGHAVPALYAILCKKGFLPKAELNQLRKIGSRLQGHPDRVRLPLVEAATGSLGQGLSMAQGLALGLRLQAKVSRVYCLLGDGEMQEGQVWEAAMSAPKFQLSHLCVILDQNNGQIDGYVDQVMPIEPIAKKWEAFGWNVLEIDGHNIEEILEAFQFFRTFKGSQPTFILARTVKGKGVSFMENQIHWHGVAPTQTEAQKAISEIQGLKNE